VSANKRSDFRIQKLVLVDFHNIDVHSYFLPVYLLERRHGLVHGDFALIQFKDEDEGRFDGIIIATHCIWSPVDNGRIIDALLVPEDSYTRLRFFNNVFDYLVFL
jgi:hypothetical protein